MKKLALACFVSLTLILSGCAANTVSKKRESTLKYSKTEDQIRISLDNPEEVHRFWFWE